ncbi:Maintenance of telomere capping protein 5 [Coniochaeta hoffmannii]|uniref:Maintenance of telomere capping protein 5 n=1 Tax=Coniochaeta hoffmannii TaxID=91930 RepID=A0AA38SH99_9PEZI|nr:Maintenance of telomere capping protein 5 [Coniochaeta hoffmannii]
MPSVFDQLSEAPKKVKTIKSAFDSETFDADGTFHVDGLVGSATISPSGRDIALASPEGLAIIDLDSPYSAPRRLSSHGLPWLVVDVQWSPFAKRDYWVASTANHRCLVWNLNLRDDSPSGAIEHSLDGHSRAITDINFSAHHPDMLATCAVDGYVHCWDLRRPRQPALSFTDWFAGATQVKYNRQDPHILASSHDRWLHIWDDRKPLKPLKTITAHTSKIYGLDWNRTRSTGIVTCSLDKSIKFWDYGKEDDRPERVIRTDFPVWRARHTPFGWGLLAMPQNEPGNLYLYDRRLTPDTPIDGAVEPVTIFPGHGNSKVKEFLWRTRGEVNKEGLDMREFQLVSWGGDNELRLQKPDPRFLQAVGFERGQQARKNLNITRQGAVYKTFRTVEDSVHRDRRSATMSDPRPGSGGQQHRRTALTLGMHAPHRRVGPTWRGPSMKAKLPAAKDVDRSQAQIGWMRGISLAKRKAGADSPLRKDSGVFSPNYDDDEWGEPESIHEEFVRISNQLPNVKWENIDMDSLTLNASLKGPWGVDNDTIFIKVRVDIPTSYPKGKAPKFVVEKTLLMPDATHKKLEQEVNQIASQFLKRKENCLDVAFTYLLGEVDLETSTTLFKNVRDLDDDMDGLADESSSEEDDDIDIPAGGSASMSQELSASTELDPTNTLAQTQRPAIPPLPRFCGARFSNDGRLVCFFPTRDERARGLFSIAGTTDAGRDRQKDEPNFAGFGRLAQDSPPPKQRYDEASATDDQSGSDESESSTSSSDSEPTAMSKISMWYQPGRRFRKTWSANESIRSSGGGTGAGTGTGTGTSRKRAGKPKNILSIYDFRDMLPSKKQFAEEYAIFGDGADVCKHNAQVAQKYGYAGLVDIWKYAALLLRTGIPLELHEQRNHRESVLVIAKDLTSRPHDEDDPLTLSGRVKWGHHPLAQEFVNDLFEYFGSIGDIQMLAMLSCIFGETSAEDSVAIAESHLTQPETPLPMKAPSFSLEYFPTDPSLWNINYKSQASSAITTPRTAQTPAAYSDAEGSPDLAAWLGEPTSNSYSCGETPPKLGKEHLQERDSTQSLSTSPESRVTRRSNSAIGAGFAASLPRTLANMVSGSPPDPPLRKKPSPAETMLSNFAPSNITWGASTVFGVSTAHSTEPPTARTSVSDDEHRRDEIMSMIPVGVNCVPENQGLFDDDGWMSTPLLSPSHSQLYASYRYAYAELLFMWGQPLSRLEIMKFNVLREDTTHTASSIYDGGSHHGSYHDDKASSQHDEQPQTIPFSSRREQLQSILSSNRGLDVTGLCRIHETQLDPVDYPSATSHRVGGAVGTCARCPRRRGAQTQLRCVYCAEPVHALYAACLACGCASHADCLAEWHGAGEAECPAGDECRCLEEASNGQVESWTALRAAVAMAAESSSRAHNAAGPPSALPFRQRRTSVPARFGLEAVDDDDDDDGNTPSSSSNPRPYARAASLYAKDEDEGNGLSGDGIEREDWESVGSSRGIPSAGMNALLAGGGKPAPHGDEPVSAARLSLGNRLKKSLGEGRPGALRRKSGGVAGWKRG